MPNKKKHHLKKNLQKLLQLFQLYRAAAPHFLPVVKHRDTLFDWLKHARKAQITLGILLLLGIFIMPSVNRWTSDLIHSPKVKKSIFKTRVYRNKKAKSLQSTLTTLYWIGTGVTSLSLLWLALPAAVARKENLTKPLADKTAQAHTPPAGNPSLDQAATLINPGLEDTMYAASPVTPTSKMAETIGLSQMPQSQGQTNAGLSKQAAVSSDTVLGDSSQLLNANQRYVIEKELGRGGMGVVYAATDTTLSRKIALKSLPGAFSSTKTVADRFKQEAMALAQLTHPNIVHVYDLMENNGELYIVMEMVDGCDLSDKMQEQQKMPVQETVELGLAIAKALAYAHEQGVVHRDFKPGNVLISKEGIPKVTDFGLAKIAEGPSLTIQGDIMGSPRYMSPEQAQGQTTDGRTDIYSLGVTLFELLAGQAPFEGDTMAVMLKHVNEEPPALSQIASEVPASLTALIDQMLKKIPDERPATMNDVAHALAEIQQTV